LATRQATVSDGCVILFLLLQWEARRQLTLATNTNLAWLATSATDKKMLSLLVVRSFRLHHINLMRKVIEIFNFLIGDCGVGEGSWF